MKEKIESIIFFLITMAIGLLWLFVCIAIAGADDYVPIFPYVHSISIVNNNDDLLIVGHTFPDNEDRDPFTVMLSYYEDDSIGAYPGDYPPQYERLILWLNWYANIPCYNGYPTKYGPPPFYDHGDIRYYTMIDLSNKVMSYAQIMRVQHIGLGDPLCAPDHIGHYQLLPIILN